MSRCYMFIEAVNDVSAKRLRAGVTLKIPTEPMSILVDKDEFRLYVWPWLPASRPERGVPLEYAWGELSQKSRSAVASSFSRYKGRNLELVSVRFQGDVTDYGSFRVHRESRLRVKDESGDELTLALFGSVMEWNGRYKLWSYVTD